MSDKKDVGYVFQFAATLADGMSVTFNGQFGVGVDKAEINAELDKLRAAADRQRAKGEVPMLEAMLAEKEAMLRNAKLDLNQYLKKHDAADDHADRIRAKIEELQNDLERGRKQLEETRLKAL